MKFVHLTDPHLVAPGERLYGLDPADRLKRAVDSINADVPGAAFLVITGDLTHRGDAASYLLLRQSLEPLAIPCHMGIGNHDARQAFCAGFPGQPTDDAGFVQFEFEHSGRRFLMLDSVDAGEASGFLCDRRLNWLRDRLAGDDTPAMVFLHHAPVSLGIPELDRIGLRNAAEFGDILNHSAHVAHLFFGHVHRPASGVWRGIPFSTQRSLVNQSALNFRREGGILDNLEPPAYSVVEVGDDGSIVVNMHEFMDDSPRFYITGVRALDENSDPRDIDGTFTATYIP